MYGKECYLALERVAETLGLQQDSGTGRVGSAQGKNDQQQTPFPHGGSLYGK